MLRQLPNIITLSRLVFLAAIVVLAFDHWTGCATLVFFLSLIACITDWLDGFIARRYGYVTNVGKLMDAITDKFFVIGLFIVILLLDRFGNGIRWIDKVGWWILGITVLRDLVITGMRMVAARKGIVLAADTMGKRKTIWQSVSICVLFAVPMFANDMAFLGLPKWFPEFIWVNGVLYYLLAGVLAVVSGVMYCIRYIPHLKSAPAASDKGSAA